MQGDAAAAAKALREFGRNHEALVLKGGLLGEIGDLQAVLVGAGGVAQDELEQGVIGARELDQLEVKLLK
ncbi:hypothetical protein B4Q13_15575 [Lacticaseibacillus rhamnosus]